MDRREDLLVASSWHDDRLRRICRAEQVVERDVAVPGEPECYMVGATSYTYPCNTVRGAQPTVQFDELALWWQWPIVGYAQ